MMNYKVVVILEYDFLVVYKHGGSHSMAKFLSRLPNATKNLGLLTELLMFHCLYFNQNGYRKYW